MNVPTLTSRDFDLIEVALDSAASSCAMFDPDDALVGEYRDAARRVREFRRALAEASS